MSTTELVAGATLILNLAVSGYAMMRNARDTGRIVGEVLARLSALERDHVGCHSARVATEQDLHSRITEIGQTVCYEKGRRNGTEKSEK